jgi:type I restriction enzyme, S subunit
VSHFDWVQVTVGEIAAPGPHALATGPFGSSIGSRFFRSSGVPVIRGGNLSADPSIRIIDQDLAFLSPNKAAEFPRSTVAAGDLIFTCWGTVNQVGLVDDQAAFSKYVISNKQMKLTPDPSRTSSEFLYWLFSGPAMQREILAGAIGSSVPGFNLTRLRSLQIHLPPLSGQRAIAAALSDADLAVRLKRRQLEKAVCLSAGIAQHLLSGGIRLPGYSGHWRELRIGDVTTGLRGAGLSKSAVTPNGPFECLLYGELFTRYGRVIRAPLSRTSTTGSVKSRAGDVLVPGSTTTVAADLAVAASLHRSGVYLGGDVNVLRPDTSRVDPDWLAYSLTWTAKAQIVEMAQGTTIVHLYVKDLLRVSLRMPPVEEQRAIASALVDAQAQVDLLERRVAKAEAIRDGMMQDLLSGRVQLGRCGVAA